MIYRLGGADRWCFVVASIFLASACSGLRSSSEQDTHSEFGRLLDSSGIGKLSGSESAVPEISQARYDFLLGELAFHDDNFDSAMLFYEKALKVDPQASPFLQKRLAQLYVRAGKLDHALELVELGLKENPDDVQLLQLNAGILASKKETAKAIAVYRRIITLQAPNNEDAYVMLASLHTQEGNLNDAELILRELVAQKPKSIFGHYYLGRIAELKQKPDEAIKEYRKALEFNPDADVIQLDLARVYASKNKFPEAKSVLQTVLAQSPENVAARKMLGQLHLRTNSLDDAVKELQALGDLEDDPTDTRFRIALVKIQQGEFEEAQSILSLILVEKPNFAAARYYLATVNVGLKRPREALIELEKISPDDKIYVESQILAAYLHQQLKNLPAATEAINAALKSRPDDVKLLSFLSMVQRQTGEHSEAIKTQSRVIELEPKNDQHYFTLGVLYDDAEQKADGRKAMEKAIELNPKNANALNYLGYTLAEEGVELEQAAKLVRRALAIEKNNGFFIDSLGWIYFKMGKYREAHKELERAVRTVPNDAVLLEHLGEAKVKLGQNREALEVFKRALKFAPESDDKEAEGRIKAAIERLEAPPK